MKKFLSFAFGLFIIVGMLLSGCSGGSDETTDSNNNDTATNDNSGDGSKEEVTLTLWNRISKHLFDNAVKGFESKHPNINVKVVNLPKSEAANAQYQAAVSQDNLPDLFIQQKYSLPQFVKLDQVHKLDSVFTEEFKKKFLPSSWYTGNTLLNGHVYQMPIYSSLSGTYMMFYNKKVLQKYGIENIPKTWDEMISVGKKIYNKSDGAVYGVMLGAKSNYIGRGAALAISRTISPATGLNYKTGKYNYATKGMVDTMNFFKKMMDQKVLYPGSLTLTDIKAIPIFTTGRAAFLISGNWAGGIMKDKSGFTKFGVTPLPRPGSADGVPPLYVGGPDQGLLISKYTEHWKQAKMFMQYLVKHLYAEVVKEGRQLPSKKPEYIDGDVKSATPHYQDIADLMRKSAVRKPNPIARNTAAWQVSSKFSSLKPHKSVGAILRGYLSGHVSDPKAVLEQMTQGYNKAFKQALQSFDKVSIEDYQFSNWMPGEPYTIEDLKELKSK